MTYSKYLAIRELYIRVCSNFKDWGLAIVMSCFFQVGNICSLILGIFGYLGFHLRIDLFRLYYIFSVIIAVPIITCFLVIHF